MIDRRPTYRELEELIALVRRDPAAFVALGDAYLALGRPHDAIAVGRRGLDALPDKLDGRMMVARAQMALHEWKDAQRTCRSRPHFPRCASWSRAAPSASSSGSSTRPGPRSRPCG